MKLPDTATYAGAVVVTTVALVTAAFTLTACLMFVSSRPDAAKDVGALAVGALSTLTALLARTKPDPKEPGER